MSFLKFIKRFAFISQGESSFIPPLCYLFWVSWRHTFTHDSRRHGTSGCHTQGFWRLLCQDCFAFSKYSPDYHQKFKYIDWLFVKTSKKYPPTSICSFLDFFGAWFWTFSQNIFQMLNEFVLESGQKMLSGC